MAGSDAVGRAVAAGARVTVECPDRFSLELRTAPGSAGIPLHREELDLDLPPLVDEAFTRGVLADVLPADPEEVHVEIGRHNPSKRV